MTLTKDVRFLIVGLGLIGGSYARILKKQGFKVYGLDQDLKTCDYALMHQYVDEASDEANALVAKADYIIVALYPSDTVKWIQTNQNLMKNHALISDVSGIKVGIVDTIQSFLRADLEFISTHPMAGKEVSGIVHSDENLFLKANYIVCPTDHNSPHGILIAKELGELLHFKNIVQLSLQEHDQMIGFLSQLTHVIAVCLMNTNDNTHLKEYTGDSFRELTRIAKINEKLWTELFFLNKDILIENISAFITQMTHFKESLSQDEHEELKNLMRESTKRRQQFDE